MKAPGNGGQQEDYGRRARRHESWRCARELRKPVSHLSKCPFWNSPDRFELLDGRTRTNKSRGYTAIARLPPLWSVAIHIEGSLPARPQCGMNRSASSLLTVSGLALAVSGIACSRNHDPLVTVRPPQAPSPSPTISPQPTIPVSQFVRSVFDPLNDWERGAVAPASNKIPNRGRYEVVQSNYGEIAGAYGLALIVVDKALSGPKQFSLIVFIRRPPGKYDLYSIFTNEDLTRVSLNRESGDIFFTGFRGTVRA